MGTINHNAIVVTGYHEHLPEAHAIAVGFGLLVTPMGPIGTNGYQSFLVCPDGSKEYWNTSDEFNVRRKVFREWLARRYRYDWVEVQFGELDGAGRVVAPSEAA